MTGISYIDATSIDVYHPKRISRNKVFKGLAKLGKTTYGWFFGFIAFLIIFRTDHNNTILASWLTTAIKMFSPPVRTIVRRAILL